MQEFHLKDEPSVYGPGTENLIFLVSYYTDGGYDGSGCAAGLCEDGVTIHWWSSLSHCSCYGPFDNENPYVRIPLIEFLQYDTKDPSSPDGVRKESDYDYQDVLAVVTKMKQLTTTEAV